MQADPWTGKTLGLRPNLSLSRVKESSWWAFGPKKSSKSKSTFRLTLRGSSKDAVTWVKVRLWAKASYRDEG